MSNKERHLLYPTDKKLRELFPPVMWDNNETIITITMFGGFELFNTRRYHNYETFSSGYRITTGERYGNITVEAEDLDDALKLMERKLIELREGKELK